MVKKYIHKRKKKGRRPYDNKSKKEIEEDMDFIKKYKIKLTLGTAFAVMGFLVLWSFKIAEYKTNVDNTFKLVNTTLYEQKETIIKLKNENIDVKVRFATIETKLANIETLLHDIKKDMRRKK